MAAKVSRDQYVWRGADRTRSFAEFRLLRDLLKQDLPVPRPIAASYLPAGPFYRDSILMEPLHYAGSLADMAAVYGHSAPGARDRRPDTPPHPQPPIGNG